MSKTGQVVCWTMPQQVEKYHGGVLNADKKIFLSARDIG